MEWASVGFTSLPQNLELEIATDAQALWEAFDTFCRDELGTEPKKLVKLWFKAALPEIEELERLTDGVELDAEKLEENKALLEDGWSKLVKS